jgi:hypothetical protein
MVQQTGKTKGEILRAVLVAAVALFVPVVLTAADNKACKLLTAAELEPVIGGKLSAFNGGSYGTADVCTAKSASATVMLRWAKKKEGSASGNAAAAGLEIARKMGATVDVKTFGAITCSTVIPPKDKEVYGFNTTCSVSKATEVAAVEVTAKTQKDMVAIDKLHPLAEKIAGRF